MVRNSYGEEVVLDDAAVVAHEVQHLGLRAARAVHHAVNLRAKGVEQPFHHRSVCAGGREDELAGIQRAALYGIGQAECAAIYQFLGHGVVVALRIFLGQVFGKDVVAGGGEIPSRK